MEMEIAKPLVSVIIPAYNAEKYILPAIQSVIEQNYAPLEILLIDDGSTDSTVKLVQRETPQVRIIQQANAGVAAARNTGLRHALGEYICFLDADDGWFPGKLAAQVDYLTHHPEVGLVFHRWLVWRPDANGVYLKQEQPLQFKSVTIDPADSGWIYTKLLLDCIVHTSTVMLRRNIAQQVGFFDRNLTNGEDYNYWLRVSRLCPIHKLSGVYSYYREVIGSLSNTPKTLNFEYLVVQRAVMEWGLTGSEGKALSSRQIKNRLAKLAFGFGFLHFHGGSLQLARQAFFKAVRHNPFMWRGLIYLAVSQLKILTSGSNNS